MNNDITETLNVTFDKQRMTSSKTFQEDEITKLVNEFNEMLAWGKINKLELKLKNKNHPVVNVGGFLITQKTFLKLVEEGIITIKEA